METPNQPTRHIHGSAPRKRIVKRRNRLTASSRDDETVTTVTTATSVFSSNNENNIASTLTESELQEIIDHWHIAKDKISKYQKELDQCKSEVEKYMNSQNINHISSVKRRMTTRESVSKNDMPAEIWSQYSKKSNFWTYTLK